MKNVPDYFGSLVFDDRVMKANLSAEVYQSLRKTIDEGAKLALSVALDDVVELEEERITASDSHGVKALRGLYLFDLGIGYAEDIGFGRDAGIILDR